ncbi:MAG: tripartite tricarboxylate transporter substrate binding protein [Xanthobacteraceae bacterium]|jgi:tripartite-type tricarboxylate transporter receptor subunit TctC
MLRFGFALLLAIGTLGAVHAQSVDAPWPTKPIRFIVPLPAGSVADLVARIVAAKLSDRLGQPIIVDNRPGASGSIGAEAVARAAPDGYTMGLATGSTHAIAVSLNPNLSYDPVKDFAPISMLSDSPYVLVVTKELEAKNIAELIAMAKAKPGALRYSTDGPASLAQFAGALFATMAGVELTPVPYHSATHAVIDLMEGRIEMQFGLVGASLPFIQQGKLRALAVTSRRRVDVLPDVPTLSESGLPGYEAVLWMALVMPPGTPPAIVERVNRDTRALLAEPEVQKALAALVMQAASSTPEELRERIRRDIEKWRRLAAEAGIKAE